MPSSVALDAANYAIDGLFFFDILFNFRTAYRDHQVRRGRGQRPLLNVAASLTTLLPYYCTCFETSLVLGAFHVRLGD